MKGTAARDFPFPFNRIFVAGTSISRRPSLTRTSSSCPGRTPSASRSALGTTSRPAESMVVFTPEFYHREWHSPWAQPCHPQRRSSGRGAPDRLARLCSGKRWHSPPNHQCSIVRGLRSTGAAGYKTRRGTTNWKTNSAACEPRTLRGVEFLRHAERAPSAAQPQRTTGDEFCSRV